MNVEHLWKSLSQVNEWIRFADAKAAAILAASGVLGGLLVKVIPKISDFKIHPVRSILLIVAIMCVGISTLIALRTLAPRLRTGEARSLIYFDHVARRYPRDRNAFVDTYVDLLSNEDRFARHVADQVWANSLIARRKFRRVSYGIIFLGIAMACSGAAVLVQRLWAW